MNTFLQAINFLGVLVLVGLCTLQWKDNSQLHHEGELLLKTRQEQSTKISEQEKSLANFTTDLDDLRQKQAKSEAALKECQGKLTAETAAKNLADSAKQQLITERDQLKAAIEKWNAAIAQRDDALRQAGEQIQKLSGDRNDAVNKFNDLANKYNELMKEFNALQAKANSSR